MSKRTNIMPNDTVKGVLEATGMTFEETFREAEP